MPGLLTVMTVLMAKVFPKSHKLFLGIREDSTPLARSFFQCLGLIPSFFFACYTSAAPHARTSMWVLSGGRRDEREVESCVWHLRTSSQPLVGITAQMKHTVHKIITTQIQPESHLSFSHKQKHEAESSSEVHTCYQTCENSRGEKILFPTDCWMCSHVPSVSSWRAAVAHTPWNVSGTGAFFSWCFPRRPCQETYSCLLPGLGVAYRC